MASEPAAELLERRWFAAMTAARNRQSECEVLRGVLELAADAWHRACAQLEQLEELRDALGEQLAVVDGTRPTGRDMMTPRAVMSAA